MQPFPHQYSVTASADETGEIALSAPSLPTLASAAPVEFGGPGDRWSPETLLMAAVSDCFVLTFRAIAQASRVSWLGLRCEATGTLDRDDGIARFTAVVLSVELTLPAGGDPEKGRRLLEKAERACLITRSLAVQPQLVAAVATAS